MNCYKCATPLPDHSKFCMACGADVSGEGHTHNTLSGEPDPELLAALQTELGKEFVVERELGRGGMAIVYLGQDTHLGRKVAIKLLPPMLTFGSGPGFIERFKREARTAATLDHPNIIPVYRVSTGGKLFWYVMKYLEGESLDILLKREGALDIDRTIAILAQAAEALDYAHQSNVVHRDVKPANIMIDKRGRVTVTDFGIAKALENTGLTNSGATIGTPHYMAPEQCVGVGVTGASDQYSLGISAYQMLSGHLPFSAESVLELMRMHAQDPPPPLQTLRPGIPAGVVAAVVRTLAKEGKDRFASCSEFTAELSRAQREATAAGRRPTPVIVQTAEEIRVKKPAAAAPAPPVPPKAPTLHTSLTVRRATSIGGMIAGAIGVALIVVIVLDQVFRDPNTSDTAPEPSAGVVQTTKQPPVESTSTVQRNAPNPVVVPPRVELQGVPTNAIVMRDGQRVSGTSFDLEAGKRTIFEVSKAGFTTWRQAFTPDSAQQLSASVTLQVARTPTRTASSETIQAGKQAETKRQPESRPVSANAPPVRADSTTTNAPAVPAKLTVGSRPSSAISINGRAMPSNPVIGQEVPAGRVVIRFQVTDSTGVWSVDTVITVAPGELRNLGRVPLVRRP